jgi:hypothetical protein
MRVVVRAVARGVGGEVSATASGGALPERRVPATPASDLALAWTGR